MIGNVIASNKVSTGSISNKLWHMCELPINYDILPNARLLCKRTIGHLMLRCAWTSHTCVSIWMCVRSEVHHAEDTLCEGVPGSTRVRRAISGDRVPSVHEDTMGDSVRTFRSDNGGEYTSNDMKTY